MADPGTHADVDSNVYFRLSAFITAIMGILLMAAIIGFVVDAIVSQFTLCGLISTAEFI